MKKSSILEGLSKHYGNEEKIRIFTSEIHDTNSKSYQQRAQKQ